jgi:hypothetical protein
MKELVTNIFVYFYSLYFVLDISPWSFSNKKAKDTGQSLLKMYYSA